MAEEMKRKRRWCYISFADQNGFLSAVIVRANGPLTAEQRARDLGIHTATARASVMSCTSRSA
jgi:hypothetical protein